MALFRRERLMLIPVPKSGQFRPMEKVAIGSRIDYCTLMGIIYQVVGNVFYYPLVGSPEPRSDSIQ